jgi:hypothetical protein
MLALAFAVTAAAGGGCTTLHSREFLAPETQREAVKSAAVLPLENLTATLDEGKIVADLVSTELSARKLSVIDRGRAEASLARVDVVSGGTVDRLAAQRLGEILGVDAVVFGSVSEAQAGTNALGPTHASVGLTVRVVDVKSGQYLLAGSYTATAGKDAVTDAARKAAGEIAKAVGK